MKILFGSDYYHPSVGGLQIVIKEIAERLVKFGHQVTVATGKMANRKSLNINGVNIEEFDVQGSFAHGLSGKVKHYQNFILENNFDAFILKAAQSWAVDALIPVLDKITMHKVFIPCGFSALYNPFYTEYYQIMPEILRKFDHLIFYANDYRDINFAREHNISNFSIIPNGASEKEFSTTKQNGFRDRLNISQNDFLVLTVGTFSGSKGHTELAQAFQLANFNQPATLLLNGNSPSVAPKIKGIKKFKYNFKISPTNACKQFLKGMFTQNKSNNLSSAKPRWKEIAQAVNSEKSDKKIIITDLSRSDVIQAFLNSDLFIFASNIEYSPLVLFESAAAGLPFLTVPVGNAAEIIKLTKGGLLCPAPIDKNGRTRVDPQVLTQEMEKLSKDYEQLSQLGNTGKENWKKSLTWEIIAHKYEKILEGNYINEGFNDKK